MVLVSQQGEKQALESALGIDCLPKPIIEVIYRLIWEDRAYCAAKMISSASAKMSSVINEPTEILSNIMPKY